MKNPIVDREQAAAGRLKMVERFRGSGMIQRAFCQTEGIPVSTLSWWVREAREISRQPGRTEYREVRMAPAAPLPDWSTELISPRGWTIRCSHVRGAGEMARLLKSLKC